MELVVNRFTRLGCLSYSEEKEDLYGAEWTNDLSPTIHSLKIRAYRKMEYMAESTDRTPGHM